VSTRRPRSSSILGLSRELIDAVGVILTQARSALFITGGGLAADSGLPMYRGIAGIPRRRADDGPAIEAALSVEGLARRPDAAWQRLRDMDHAIRHAAPNRGHEVLALLDGRLERCVTMTQNIDGLERRAGLRRVIEMHGLLHELRCPRCAARLTVPSFVDLPIPPGCARCHGPLRPDMVLFGEALAEAPFTAVQAELERGFDIVLSIGVTSMAPYLARPILVAKSEGIPTVEIGAAATDLSELVDFRFRGTPARVLDLFW
jgi:NAD-dependent deacetylase